MHGAIRPFSRRALAVVGLCAAVAGSVMLGTGGDSAHAAEKTAFPATPQVNAKDAERATAVVAAEDRRLTEIRTIVSLARWQGKSWKTPYRLGTSTGYTLVLTPKSTPYTIDDLLRLAPQTFLRMSDGSYLLTENIAVTTRATLHLAAPGGLTLRMASNSDGFATIVSFGGKVELVGEQDAPITITSWDPSAGTADDNVFDGRAYIRAIGGQFEAEHVHLSHLGFWSGRTGGLALTGTDRPNTGAIETGGKAQDEQGDEAPSLLDGVKWQPAGALEEGQHNPTLDLSVPESDYVSSRISDVVVDKDAFGLFVSGANGVQIANSTFSNSRLGGVVLHRYVTNAVISSTTSRHNVGDGFTLDRATTGIVISESTAIANSESGFNLSGRPLADGPSAIGASLRNYGNNSVSNSTAADNGHYGIEVVGGFNIGIQNNTVRDQDMGVMVNGPAARISVTGNRVTDASRHGVALVNGVSDATVTGNVIDEAETGVYLRDSVGMVKGNTIQNADLHGVSLVGQVQGSDVSFNVLAGSGPSALDTVRARGLVTKGTNNDDGWLDTTPWYYWFKKLLQPMTAMWTAIAVLIITSAIRSHGNHGAIEHPYAHQMAHQEHLPMPVPRTDETFVSTE